MLDFTTNAGLQERTATAGQFSLRDLTNGIFYYRWIALIVAAAVVAVGVLVAVLLPPTYSAEARLLPLSAGIYDMQDAGRPPQPGQVLDAAAVVNVELQMLDSLELHRTVVREQLGASASREAIDAALDKFEKNLHVTKATEANVIELTYLARDPHMAARTLQTLIGHYFETRADVLTSGRVAYLAQQRDTVKAQLDRANAGIAGFQRKNGIVDIAAQVAGAVAQDDLLRKNKLDTDAALADGRRSLGTLQSAARGTPANVQLYSDNTEAARALGEMQASLLALQAKRADLASRFMATSPQVTQVTGQIDSLQKTIALQQEGLVTTKRTGRNQYFDSSRDRLDQTRASVSGATARAGALSAQIGQSRVRLNQLIGIADQIAAMKLDRDVLADSFKSLSTQVEQARVQLNQTSGAGSSSVRVIEAPTPPAKRSNPPALLIAGSMVAALLIAATTVVVMSSLREMFLSPMEVERALSLPVLAAPRADDDDAGLARHRAWGKLLATIDATGHAGSKAVLLIAPTGRMSLQTAALGLGAAIERRRAGSTILVRFAEDATVPDTVADLAIQPCDGIATTVIGTAACSNPRADARLIAELKTRFDYVIVTAPPVADGFEGIELAGVVDMVVPVVEAETTRSPAARSLIAQLEEAHASVPGAILLGWRSYLPDLRTWSLIPRRLRTAAA